MPIRKTAKGYKIDNTPGISKTRKEAVVRLKAIKANQNREQKKPPGKAKQTQGGRKPRNRINGAVLGSSTPKGAKQLLKPESRITKSHVSCFITRPESRRIKPHKKTRITENQISSQDLNYGESNLMTRPESRRIKPHG